MDATLSAMQRGLQGASYRIVREVDLCDKEFRSLAEDFLKDMSWLGLEDGGVDPDGTLRCIRVRNADTLETVLVNNEGYGYPRYTAIENIIK